MSLTHASFFSGAGGMDIGLERAGWQTVSFSEIEPYACAILAERWPHIPNLGNIMDVDDVPSARLWTGGFPCQDLSVAGKRGGIDASRSGLAWTFLDLVERHRPEAFILENVPGLLSSNAGRDFGRLLREVGDLGYGWAYRLLDAQFFGVPQRRRRVFVLALDLDRHPDADSAGQVLAIGASCGRDHQAGRKTRTNAADGLAAGIARSLSTSQQRTDAETETFIVGQTPDSGRVRAVDGMAGRVDARTVLAESGIVTSLSSSFGDGGPDAAHAQAGWLIAGRSGEEDELLPVGHDSNRYRAIGNGVAAPVAEWIGRRLATYLRETA